MDTLEASTRERLLDAADQLMYERGFEAVGIAELCKAADAKKGSFYYFFDSKQHLALEMLERAWQRTQATIFADSLSDTSLSGLDAIDRYGHLLAANLERLQAESDSTVGCRFANFAVEMSTRDNDIRSAVANVFDEMIALTRSAIERAIAANEIAPDTDIDSAATAVISQMEGLMVLAKARRDPQLLRSLGPTIRQLLT